MRKFLILASLVACCMAAPTTQHDSHEHEDHNKVTLSRPSPINPDVLSDPKPQEKITKITDPKEITKFKRETVDDPYDHISHFAPTVQPEHSAVHTQASHEKQNAESTINHHRQKREKRAHVATPAPVRKSALKKDSSKQTTQRQTSKSAVPVPASAHDLPKSRLRRQVDPHLIGASAVPVTPLIPHEEDAMPQVAVAQVETQTEVPATAVTESVTQQQQAQTIAAVYESLEPVPVKRDIPVPLVPKYQHPEESPKTDENKETNVEATNNEKQQDNAMPQSAEQHIPAEQKAKHQNSKPNKSSESSESDESNESGEKSKEKTPKVNQQQVQHAATLEPSQHNQQQAPVQQPHIEEESVKPAEHIKPLNIAEIAPVPEQLATIKPTQIIAYEPAPNDEHLALKHPVPVAELFGRPKQ